MTDPGTPQALRHPWASPAPFVLGAFVAFDVVGSREAGWALMAGGLSGPVVALGGRRYGGNARRRRSSSYRSPCRR
ncbi:hypothetical protein ACFT8V_28845 [Streptomyces griseoincarnatus]|uniref:hypothetical protein n=1 Tax=Streptomyces sp. BSE7-9 TaxID=2759948 RepID=UPI0013D36226|nr:hypothetical protein [Streptomyces sp. BSE7-9]MBJ6644791.1 hypothetical protein [Streptomyces sp. BSE7-9]NEA94142.1 hypothetical protein [Actinospica acidiphila]